MAKSQDVHDEVESDVILAERRIESPPVRGRGSRLVYTIAYAVYIRVT